MEPDQVPLDLLINDEQSLHSTPVKKASMPRTAKDVKGYIVVDYKEPKKKAGQQPVDSDDNQIKEKKADQ